MRGEHTLKFFLLFFSPQTLIFAFISFFLLRHVLFYYFLSSDMSFFSSQQSSSFQFNLAARDLLEVNILNISNLHLGVVCLDSTYVLLLFCILLCCFTFLLLYICFYCFTYVLIVVYLFLLFYICFYCYM